MSGKVVTNHLKELVAHQALSYVKSGMRLGLGTGTTVYFFFQALAAALKEGRLENIVGVPSSLATEVICQELSIPTMTLGREALDLYVDGADIITADGWVVKGGGGALLREKIVAISSLESVIIADASKYRDVCDAFILPVEILPFGYEATIKHVQDLLHITDAPTLLMERNDNGHFVFQFTVRCQEDMVRLGEKLKSIAGVVEHGLFFLEKERRRFIVASSEGVVTI